MAQDNKPKITFADLDNFLKIAPIIGLAILGMSIGIIFNNKPLQGSCGGVVENCVCLKGGDCDDPSQQPNINSKD